VCVAMKLAEVALEEESTQAARERSAHEAGLRSAELTIPQSVAATLCRERTRWHSCPKNDNFHTPTGTRVGRCISVYECGHLGTFLDEGDLAVVAAAADMQVWMPGSASGGSLRRVTIAGRCYECRLNDSRRYMTNKHRTREKRDRTGEKVCPAKGADEPIQEEPSQPEVDEEALRASQQEEKSRLLQLRTRAIMKLQSWFRKIVVHKWRKVWHHDATIIQCAWRRFISRKRINLRRSEVHVQRAQTQVLEQMQSMEEQIATLKAEANLEMRRFQCKQAIWLFSTTLKRRHDLTL